MNGTPRKIKINLSRDCVKRLIDSIDIGSSKSRAEGDGMERILEDLSWSDEHRDENGRLEITRETLDWVLAELDWYCTAYLNREDDERKEGTGHERN